MVRDEQEINSQKVMFTHAGSKTFVCTQFFHVYSATWMPEQFIIGQQTSNLLEVFGQSINNLRVGTCKETASHLNEKITMTVDNHLSR